MNAYQSRQAAMIAQWKEAAKKDGWATYGMWFWQLAEAHLAVSTALNEMTPEQQGFKSELPSLTQETADQVRMAVARNDAMIESLYSAGTVSYTRLDVYKRHSRRCEATRSGRRCGRRPCELDAPFLGSARATPT